MEINQDLNKPVDDNSIDTIQMKEPQEQRPANPEPTPQPAAPSSPATPTNDNCNDTSCHNKGVHTAILACNIVLLIGLIVLYILHFTGMGSPSKFNPEASMPVIPKTECSKWHALTATACWPNTNMPSTFKRSSTVIRKHKRRAINNRWISSTPTTRTILRPAKT